LKHVAERAGLSYVANGVLIAAAIACGFPVKPQADSPNAFIGIAERSIGPTLKADQDRQNSY